MSLKPPGLTFASGFGGISGPFLESVFPRFKPYPLAKAKGFDASGQPRAPGALGRPQGVRDEVR